MASAISTPVTDTTNIDNSIAAQDSEIISGLKQTNLGGNTYAVGNNSTVTDAGAFEMVGNVGIQFLKTVGNLANSFANSTMDAVSTLSAAASPSSSALQSAKDFNSIFKYAIIAGAVVGVAYVLGGKK